MSNKQICLAITFIMKPRNVKMYKSDMYSSSMYNKVDENIVIDQALAKTHFINHKIFH